MWGPELTGLYTRAGVTPVDIPDVHAVQQNLADSKIDGAKGGLSAYVNWGWAERLKFISNWPIGSNYLALVVNMDDWNSLTPDLQQKLLKAAEELEKKQWAARQANNDSFLNEAMTKYGVKVMNPPPADIAKLMANVNPVLDDWKKRVGPDSAMIFAAINTVLGTNYK